MLEITWSWLKQCSLSQIHTQKHKATCGPDHVLRLSSQDMSEVFITSMAELPGLLVAALLIDVLGRRRLNSYVLPIGTPCPVGYPLLDQFFVAAKCLRFCSLQSRL